MAGPAQRRYPDLLIFLPNRTADAETAPFHKKRQVQTYMQGPFRAIPFTNAYQDAADRTQWPRRKQGLLGKQ